MSEKKEIWLLVDSSGFGGIETHLLQLATGLQVRNIAVRVVLLKFYRPHPLFKELNDRGIPYSVTNGAAGLFKLAFNIKPAIIHTHGYKAGVVGRLTGKTLGIKVASTFHAGEVSRGRVAVYDKIDRSLAFLADHVFAVSEKVTQRLNVPYEVIENFVETASVSPSYGDNIAFVGRLSYEKGPDIFIDIANKNKRANFHIYGDGPMAKTLMNAAENHVIFHGMQPQMDAVWHSIGLLVITSRFEGLPMAAIEAMARGVPVIAFNVGALDTLIEHGNNGWLVPPGDVKTLQKIIYYWQALSPQEKGVICKKASIKVQQAFSCEAVIPKYLACYKNLDSTIGTDNTCTYV